MQEAEDISRRLVSDSFFSAFLQQYDSSKQDDSYIRRVTQASMYSKQG